MQKQYLYQLGRESELALAELEARLGSEAIISNGNGIAIANSMHERPDVLGGTIRIAEVLPFSAKTADEIQSVLAEWLITHPVDGKRTVGISCIGMPKRLQLPAQKLALNIKRAVRAETKASIRIVNKPGDNSLNAAQVLRNKLTSESGVEFLIFSTSSDDMSYGIAITRHMQDIDAYAARDHGRPARDNFVGMLPPKLAQILISLSLSGNTATDTQSNTRILDPFCGTGVVLQEAALQSIDAYGTDLSERMVTASTDNLQWLHDTYDITSDTTVEQGDAQTHTWSTPVTAIAAETYLGPPLRGQAQPADLEKTIAEINTLHENTLKNIAAQVAPGTAVVLAVPQWHFKKRVYSLPVVDYLEKLGYNRMEFEHSRAELVYHRPGQAVAREILALRRK